MCVQEVQESLTLNGVSLSRIGDAISVQESVFALKHVLDHFSHGAVIKLLLRGLWWKDLWREIKTLNFQDKHLTCSQLNEKYKELVNETACNIQHTEL